MFFAAVDVVHGDELWAVPTTLPGDVDKNGDVDFADFLILSSTFGDTVAPGTGADIDGDGVVGFADFLLLSANFGESW